ncbi:MAG: dephospho-CoA kinase [Clostridiales bacterium]|nr:dephospho-CoA kinase [Clostridiales bacterium]
MTERTGMRQNENTSADRPVGQDPKHAGVLSDRTGKRILGITGGVGAGKSTILTYLKERYGARTLEADAVAHLLQQPGLPCWERIVDTFGTDILCADRTIDRRKLGTVVYADRTKLDKLNAIVHPAVKTYICREITHNRSFVVIEAALLLEDHYEEICDEIWYIYADESIREERLVKSRDYSHEKVRQIMGNQLKEDEFRRRCQVVIDNSGRNPCEAYAQIDRALDGLWDIHCT